MAAAVAFGAVLDATEGDPITIAVNLAYPTADLLLLVISVGTLALTGWRPGRMWSLLAGGLVVWAVADTWYLLEVASDTYVQGTPLESLWPIGSALMAIAAWAAPEELKPRPLEGTSVLAIPTLFALAALGLLVYDRVPLLAGDHHISELAVGLAALTVLAALIRLVVSFRELRSLAESRRQAVTDELTGLGNRRLLYDRLQAALGSRRDGESLALLLVDLDRFKEVNDALGHHVGDELLQQLGPRLAGSLRGGDVLARLGGDEFAVLLRATDAAGATAAARRILASLQQPFDLRDLSVHIDASVGIALCPDHAGDADTLLRRADVAMYQAKSHSTGCEVYAAERDHSSRDRLQVVAELSAAIEAGQLVLHYQPLCDLQSGAVVGVEALVRWAHPERGLLSPDAFLPVAEQTALMRPLTRLVLAMALRQCREWRDAGAELRVSVNVSVTNLLDGLFPSDVEQMLTEHGLPPEALRLEITENTLLADPVRAQEVVRRLHELGVGVAVDDYGTGYSSLAYLRQLEVDELKLDRSFASRVVDSAKDAAIVRSTVELANALDLVTVAEGVESEALWDELARLGCTLAQGFYLSRPLPADELTTWLQGRRLAAAETVAPGPGEARPPAPPARAAPAAHAPATVSASAAGT